jgi:selenocysteine-specific elongation factor
MKTCCIVVIGHVDHGKTSLVHALTGIDTDRLPEEKARGLSIISGFAHRTYEGSTIDFIDAPGHEDFVQAMVSGASGASAAMIVISAVEGIGAQTLEHLSIVRLLGITNCLVAITKSDLLNPSEHAACLIEIRGALLQSPLSNGSMIMCSAKTGDGLDDLHEALQKMVPEAAQSSNAFGSYLPIDRVFSIPGQGTVVTGTLLGQDLNTDDKLMLEPMNRAVTLRSLQSRGTQRDVIHVGERMAANLRGIAVTDIPRGTVLCAQGAGKASSCIDVQIVLQPEMKRSLMHMQDVRVLFGTSSEVATVRLYGAGRLGPAGSSFAQLRFKKYVTGFAGQRAILRGLSPSETIGGAVFLDPQATKTKAGDKARLCVLQGVQTHDIQEIARALCKSHGGVTLLSDVGRLSRTTVPNVRVGLGEGIVIIEDVLCSPNEQVEECKLAVLALLQAYHTTYPLRVMATQSATNGSGFAPALVQHVQQRLAETGRICIVGNNLAMIGHDPMTSLSSEQLARLRDLENSVRAAGLTAQTPDSFLQGQLDNDLLAILTDTGRLVSVRNVSLNQTLVFHMETLEAATIALRIAFPLGQSFTTSQARTALATSRRVIVPLLEYFDGCAVTERQEQLRQMNDANVVPSVVSNC